MDWKIKVGIYTGCMFFTASSYTMLVPFLPLYLLELGADEGNIGFWSAATFSVCFLVGGIMAPIWGHMADAHGQKAMATRAAFMLFIAYSSGGLVQTPLQLFLMRVLQGFSNGYLPAVLTIVSSIAPVRYLGTGLSLVQSSMLVGTISGPLIGGVLAHWFGYRASFFVAGAALLAVFIVTWFVPGDRTPRAERGPEPSQGLRADFRYAFGSREIRRIVVLFFVFSGVVVAVQPIMSLFIKELAPDAGDLALVAGIALSIPSVTGSLAAPLWGWFGQRRGYYLACLCGALGGGVFLAGQGLCSDIMQLYVISALQGLFIVGVSPSLNSQLSLCTPQSFRARAFGIMTMAGQFGSMVGPMVAGFVGFYFSLRCQFYLSGLMLVLIGLYVAWVRLHAPPPPPEPSHGAPE